ncbi:kinase-like domain-containing protein [Trichoderma barbatum]
MAMISNSPTRDLNYFTLSAANPAAIHLLSEIQSKSSPPTLQSGEDSIGYRISIPSHNSQQDEISFKWRIGAGPSPIIAKMGDVFVPEILLCPQEASQTPSSKTVRAYIKHIHGVIFIHPQSGALVLRSRSAKPIIYEQGDMNDQDVEICGGPDSKARSCVLRRKKNYLQFGPYRFLLEFTVSHQDRNRFSKTIDRSLHHHYHKIFNFIPTPEPETLWNIWLHRKISNSSSLQSGIHINTGQPVAVKTLRSKVWTRKYMVDQIKLASQYKDKPEKGILGIIDVWCEHWTSPPCVLKPSSAVTHCRNTYFSMPLAEQNFLHRRWRRLDTSTHLKYLYHTLCGLAELHDRGIVHGNIQPEYLLIYEQRAFISLCMQRPETYDASICVAPEAWLDKYRELDETKLDIWGLAISWLFTCLRPPPDLMITRHAYKHLQMTLSSRKDKGRISEPLFDLLQEMLAWDPCNRPSATEALNHKVWLPILPRIARRAKGSRTRRPVQTVQGSQSKKAKDP